MYIRPAVIWAAIPARSRASVSRCRSSRPTRHCAAEAVFTVVRTTAPSAVICSTPSTSGVPMMSSRRSGSSVSAAAASRRTWVALSTDTNPTGTSTMTRAQPWLLLPTRMISPLRTYQTNAPVRRGAW